MATPPRSSSPRRSLDFLGRGGRARGLALAAALLVPGALLCPSTGGATIRLGNRGGPDADGDGVADDIDRCPERAGPVDNIGCPDRDEDGDGIVDRLDWCPSVPGTARGCPSGDGVAIVNQVPDVAPAAPAGSGAAGQGAAGASAAQSAADAALVRLPGRRFEFAEPVRFAPATDELTPEGRAAIEAAARIILARPELRRLIIGGHVDEPGNTAERAKALSLKRAEAVKRVLVAAGVAPERLRPRGFGYNKLLDKSETPEAAKKNNRIKIVVD